LKITSFVTPVHKKESERVEVFKKDSPNNLIEEKNEKKSTKNVIVKNAFLRQKTKIHKPQKELDSLLVANIENVHNKEAKIEFQKKVPEMMGKALRSMIAR